MAKLEKLEIPKGLSVLVSTFMKRDHGIIGEAANEFNEFLEELQQQLDYMCDEMESIHSTLAMYYKKFIKIEETTGEIECSATLEDLLQEAYEGGINIKLETLEDEKGWNITFGDSPAFFANDLTNIKQFIRGYLDGGV